jgi:predicted aldo/keto reductase-like oxidoreductase
MTAINRRDFMKRSTAGALATTFAAGQQARAEAPLSPATRRMLGQSGIECSLLGQGSGSAGWAGESNQTRLGQAEFVAHLEAVYEQGITYFDLADMYGSHGHMKHALSGSVDRDKATILTKTVSREPELVKADLERFRQEIGTEYLDIVLMHCLTDGEWPTKLQGCMDVLSEAKARGQIRAVGVSCHSLEAIAHVPDSDWVDVVLARINPFGVSMDGKPEEVVPVLQRAHGNGKGVLGMKIVGMGKLADKLDESLSYVVGLGCVDAMTIGFESMEQVADIRQRLGALQLA